ncbi:uncharacterized protein LOC111444234 isoform X1 [Cucurbita moschata]|uniref:Uncharacterized protein LOC111444234 isoform X1 n=1 Tax=Cucurbita moschata TaxID=3662 RepID=A0A6J1FIH0_CUCMO|nr:uncharacterized protein LOC111444234 isoform X1 [Cucurbita moschata]
MLGYIDGTIVSPPRFEPETSSTLSTKYAADQRLLCLLLFSLIEEAIAVVVGLSTARDVWLALETTFSHYSKARELIFKNNLQLMKRDTKLADLIFKGESFELFQRSLESSNSTPTTFTTTNRDRTHGSHTDSFCHQRDRSHSHNNSSNRGRTHSGQGRRPPCCQICRMEGHYADRCNQRYVRPDFSHAYLVEAFNTSCSIAGPEAAHWFLDTGTSTHMTTDPSILDQ